MFREERSSWTQNWKTFVMVPCHVPRMRSVIGDPKLEERNVPLRGRMRRVSVKTEKCYSSLKVFSVLLVNRRRRKRKTRQCLVGSQFSRVLDRGPSLPSPYSHPFYLLLNLVLLRNQLLRWWDTAFICLREHDRKGNEYNTVL